MTKTFIVTVDEPIWQRTVHRIKVPDDIASDDDALDEYVHEALSAGDTEVINGTDFLSEVFGLCAEVEIEEDTGD